MSAALTMLCLPCAGGSATMYLRWRRTLPAWIRVEPIELPGRGPLMGEPYVEDFDTLVARLCERHQGMLQGRYALFGHSLGGLLAYGMTRRLAAHGMPLPRALLVSASPAPSCRRAEAYPPKGDDQALLDDLRKQGGTPQAILDDPELMRITLDTLGADYRLCESFSPAPTGALPVPLHVFAGRSDDIGVEPIEAWRDEAQGVCTVDWFDGGHFYFQQDEGGMLARLQDRLSQSVMRAVAGDRVLA